MTFDFNECIKSGVEQAMKECELTIGMTLKEAVEKQIPKKVEIEVIDDIDPHDLKPYQFKIPKCSVCGEGIGLRMYKFCPYCGQALDWSDTE